LYPSSANVVVTSDLSTVLSFLPGHPALAAPGQYAVRLSGHMRTITLCLISCRARPGVPSPRLPQHWRR
jgi:hypothetical protein